MVITVRVAYAALRPVQLSLTPISLHHELLNSLRLLQLWLLLHAAAANVALLLPLSPSEVSPILTPAVLPYTLRYGKYDLHHLSPTAWRGPN
jgi:hypothetical protein